METKTTIGKNEIPAKQSSDQWLNDMSSGMIDIYKGQMKLAFDFYNNFFNSVINTKNHVTGIPLQGFYNIFYSGDSGSNKNLFSRWNEQFAKAIKTNEGYWKNILKTDEPQVKLETDKKSEKVEVKKVSQENI